MATTVKLRKTGNSVGISLPKALQSEMGWLKDDVLLLTRRGDVLVVQRFRLPAPVTVVTDSDVTRVGK